MRYKHVTVVDDDIDIHDYAAVDWAIAYRVNAGENDIVIMPATFGLGLDPSTRKRDRNPALFGTGKWNRVLIDATMNLDYDPDPEFGGARFPPPVRPEQKDIDAAKARWTSSASTSRKQEVTRICYGQIHCHHPFGRVCRLPRRWWSVPRTTCHGRKRRRAGSSWCGLGFGSELAIPTIYVQSAPPEVLNELGYVTLHFDMRGCGPGGGERGRVICLEQVEDLGHAVVSWPGTRAVRSRAASPLSGRASVGRWPSMPAASTKKDAAVDLQRRLGQCPAQIPRPA